MRADYEAWLKEQKYSPGTVIAQLHRVGRVEDVYGSLDAAYNTGQLQKIIDELEYSSADERQSKANPSRIVIDGNIRNNLQSYKNAVVRYRKFLTGWERSDTEAPLSEKEAAEVSAVVDVETDIRNKLSLERDMQAVLRQNISQLSPALHVIDDGAERSVHSGLIDITCEDNGDQAIVVLELKAGKADSRAIGQILGYMGDIAEEEPDRTVRGLLIASDFDKRVVSAARVIPSLSLVRYAIDFRFDIQS